MSRLADCTYLLAIEAPGALIVKVRSDEPSWMRSFSKDGLFSSQTGTPGVTA